MKVLDLGGVCGHRFEGWFASEQDFQDQLARGLLECPLCGERDVSKRLSAPRINLGRSTDAHEAQTTEQSAARAPQQTAMAQGQAETRPEGSGVAPSHQVPAQLQALFWHAMKTVAAQTEDVGARFAEEARRIHHGETPARGIRGQATMEEAQALVEEGVDILPLPDLPVFKTPLQ